MKVTLKDDFWRWLWNKVENLQSQLASCFESYIVFSRCLVFSEFVFYFTLVQLLWKLAMRRWRGNVSTLQISSFFWRPKIIALGAQGLFSGRISSISTRDTIHSFHLLNTWAFRLSKQLNLMTFFSVISHTRLSGDRQQPCPFYIALQKNKWQTAVSVLHCITRK